jgi:hypothetical protein
MHMNRAKYSLLLFVIFRMLNSQIQAADLRVGKPFPGLVLPSALDGEPMSVRQFLGQKLIVQIFASW